MSDFSKILAQADILHQIPSDEIKLMARICREQTCDTGEVIFLEGSHGSELYIISEGEVDILANPALVSTHPRPDQASVTIARLRRGQCFGEIALVDDGRRSATARAALDQTRLLVISKHDLMELCQANPALGFKLMYNLAVDLALKIRSTDLHMLEYLLAPKL